MSVGWTRRSDYGELTDLQERLAPKKEVDGRSGSLMDALHDRITQVFDLTRSELRVHAAVLDELVEHTQRLESRVAELVERAEAAARVEAALVRLEGRLAAHAAAVEGELDRLMAWLDAPPAAAVVDLREATPAGEDTTGGSTGG